MSMTTSLKLSEAQKRAVEHDTGPALVLAGPGSGKTFVITSRIAHLIRNRQVDPAHILVVTFSRAAAVSMRERYLRMTAPEEGAGKGPEEGPEPGVIFGTFHSVFFRILKAAYHYSAGSILKEEQRALILRELIDGYKLEGNDRKELMERVSAEISRVKSEEIDLTHFYSSVTAADTFRSLFRAYQDALHAAGLIDFDDMLLYTKELLTKRPDILAAWQKRFTYILVDEFQDINLMQYRIIRMLCAPEDNLFAVGDDDQSIYRFRGAKPEIMLGFQKDYPDAVLVRLEDNYRCPKPVMQAAGRVIAANKARYQKNITGVKESSEPVHMARLKDVKEESEYIVGRIREGVRAGIPYEQMAVLTRTNGAGRYLASRLASWQIPVDMPELAPDLYTHWVAQDILSYLRFALAGYRRADFLQIMNRPLRYLSRSCVDTPQVDFDRLGMYYEDKPWMLARVEDLERDIRMLRTLRPFAAVNYIRRAIGYDDFIREYARERGLEEDELLEIAGEVQEDAAAYASFALWAEGIRAQREKKKARREAGEGKEQGPRGIRLATLHSSKGLEYDLVFLPDVNEGLLPYRKAVLESEIEEERRLLYVGMTRARQSLHVICVKNRFGKEVRPSRFLEELV